MTNGDEDWWVGCCCSGFLWWFLLCISITAYNIEPISAGILSVFAIIIGFVVLGYWLDADINYDAPKVLTLIALFIVIFCHYFFSISDPLLAAFAAILPAITTFIIFGGIIMLIWNKLTVTKSIPDTGLDLGETVLDLGEERIPPDAIPEHAICPICQENIRETIHRGVDRCPECGAYHHKDCFRDYGCGNPACRLRGR